MRTAEERIGLEVTRAGFEGNNKERGHITNVAVHTVHSVVGFYH